MSKGCGGDPMSAAAYRAAGQAIAAIAEGRAVHDLSVDGIEFHGEARADHRRRTDALAQIAIGLAGIAAIIRYRFGTPPDAGTSPVVTWSFERRDLNDFLKIGELIDAVDPDGEDDVFFLAWRQALELVADAAHWDAIEFFANLLEAGPLDDVHVDY